ncbi:TPA: cytoplasmic protein, partial [Bacillus tropicus]|nr:cytoplasmic protein [Bacillus tropicus]
YSLKEAYQYMESKVVKGTGDIGTPPRYGEEESQRNYMMN